MGVTYYVTEDSYSHIEMSHASRDDIISETAESYDSFSNQLLANRNCCSTFDPQIKQGYQTSLITWINL